MQIIKTFEELRSALWEDKQAIYEMLNERLEESTPFQLGRYQGQIHALDDVLNLLRNSIKYGEVE